MFLEEFRALPVVGSGMAASSALFTCFTLISGGGNSRSPISIELIINSERPEEVKEPEPTPPEPEEVKVEEIPPVVELPAPVREIIPEPKPVEVLPPKPPAKPKPKKRIPKPKRSPVNFKSKKRDNRDVFLVSPKTGKDYWLYRPTAKLDFSFQYRYGYRPFDFSHISENSLSIRLFNRPVWEDFSLGEDEYKERLSREQVNQLFSEGNHNKIKQLLYSLSVSRKWKKHIGDHFTSDRPNTIHWKPYTTDLKIKYFSDFEGFKKYVQAKVDNCGDDKPCVADESELEILPQDKISFFDQ